MIIQSDSLMLLGRSDTVFPTWSAEDLGIQTHTGQDISRSPSSNKQTDLVVPGDCILTVCQLKSSQQL